MESSTGWTFVSSDYIPPEEIAQDKLPVGEGKGILTSRLKHLILRAHVFNEKIQAEKQEITRIFIFEVYLSFREILESFYPRK